MSTLTEADRKRLKLMGLDKRGRSAFFQGKRKDVSKGNFEKHVCFNCGKWCDCWLEHCNHVTCSLVNLPCCTSPETAARMK